MLVVSALVLLATKPAPARARIPEGVYRPFFADTSLRSDAGVQAPAPIDVPSFELDVRQVSQADFLEFVRANPKWRRSQVARLFAEGGYLRSWRGDLEPAAPKSPVTEVSWFAARAYCRWRGARLPTVAEWERAAEDPKAGALILEWYSRPREGALSEAGSGAPNRFGVRGLHGLVWEWVLDFNSNLVADDARDATRGGGAQFCGGGATQAVDPNDYATFMRHGFRDSLKADYTVKDLGFRCARSP